MIDYRGDDIVDEDDKPASRGGCLLMVTFLTLGVVVWAIAGYEIYKWVA